MPIPLDFLEKLNRLHPKEIIERVASQTNPKGAEIWELRNEVRPVDLYCYLEARFGPPNGIQNFLRADDSDNLIHWEWVLECEYGWVTFIGMNFRTEIHFMGVFPFAENEKEEFLKMLKLDFAKKGARMSKIKNEMLEKWTEFFNPYHRLKSSVDQLLKELDLLSIEPSRDAIPDLNDFSDADSIKTRWVEIGKKYSKALGMCFGIRSMLPVLAESFINLLIFITIKKEIIEDRRLFDNVFRQAIDIRIKSLHLNCVGFQKPIDFSSAVCKKYHSFINERNDLLHGNVIIEKLRFNEVYFNRKVPVFQEYKTMWDRSVGVELKAFGYERLQEEVQIVDEFVSYVLSCLHSNVREGVERAMRTRDLGINEKTGGLGILFPNHLVDMRPTKRK